MNTLQRNDDWHAQRCGKITASRIKDMGAKPSKGKCYNALALTILSERLTGVQEETKTTGPMQWGIDQEQFAVIAYENETGSFVTDVGLIDHPAIKMSGASPDGLVGKNGQLEIKCPSTTTHLNTILMQEVPEEHIPQITWQLACTRREWCDFVSYDPRLPEHLQLFIKRIYAKDLDIQGVENSVIAFNRVIDSAFIQLNKKELAA
ncbi:lambda exonuclease family protein [Acinetobacter sp. TAC-1]|uniref:lambda exonuclease family protein n=1 Tax=Acinetobacter sp. TAC-1 TaxID=3027470 RepID=UPI0023AAE19D|nr:lambda exonuclease family protein [Acinetobacter sp. TAC-1]WEE40966.1 YqaJ viral recombinase family protein [Acinetobacter sp. TAC-1]